MTLEVSTRDYQHQAARAVVPLRAGLPAVDDADGDGWGVSVLDCDDGDATIYPYAREVENGRDEDCDGLRDTIDGWVGDAATVAFVDLRPDGCVPGESVTALRAALPAAGTASWSGNRAGLTVSGSSPDVTLDCPEVGAAEAATVTAMVTTSAGESAWTSATLRIYPEGHAPWGEQGTGRPGDVSTPCNPSGAAAFTALIAGALGAAALRRRAS